MFEPWMLVAMEENGYMDTDDDLVGQVAARLAMGRSKTVSNAEFRKACLDCGVDPDSFTRHDMEELQARLNQIT